MGYAQGALRMKSGYTSEKPKIPEYRASLAIMDTFSGAFCGYFGMEKNQAEEKKLRQACYEKMKYIVAEFPVLLQDMTRKEAGESKAPGYLSGIGKEQKYLTGAEKGQEYPAGMDKEQDCQKLAVILADICGLSETEAMTVIMPAWCKYMLRHNLAGQVEFARQVWNVEETEIPDITAAQEGIARFQDFICRCGLAVTMRELGIRYFDSEKAAKRTVDICGSFDTMGTLAEVQTVYELARG